MLEHVVMYVARLRSGGRKHYNMRSVLRGIFWNAHGVLCMSGAAGDGRTTQLALYHTYIHIIIYIYINNSRMSYRLCGARSGSPQANYYISMI